MIDFIISNWVEIVAAVTAIVVLADKIAAVTKNKTDDVVVNFVKRIVLPFRKG